MTDIKKRECGPEILRILLMAMIAMHHIIVHGLGLSDFSIAAKTAEPLVRVELFYNSFLVIAVNAFVLISGYYGIKYKTKSLFSLFLQATIYSISIWYISHILLGIGGSISPVQYWFCVGYFALCLISPYVNKVIAELTNKQLIALTSIVVFLLCVIGFFGNAHHILGGGYGFIQLLSIYIIGRTISRFREVLWKIKGSFLLTAFAISYLGILIPAYLLFHSNMALSWNMFSYDNPLIIINACILLLVFTKIKIQISWIRNISSHLLGVYMLHDNGFIRNKFIIGMMPSFICSWQQALFLIPLIAAAILITGIVIDTPIAIIVNLITNHRLTRKVAESIDKFVQI